MKRYGNLFETFVSFENLHSAFKKARKGTSKKKETQEFEFWLEPNLLALKEELENGTYTPAPYRYFKIFEPKERIISVAAFKDRVVHHALVNILEPIFERVFIHDSYATRKGKGTHKAVKKAQHFLGRTGWFWKTDIDKYFDNINHEILFRLIERKIKDKRLLAVVEKIISNGGNAGVGLPIGNLTSQFFANVYLDKLDRFIKQELKVKAYIRYMDDFVLFHADKNVLKDNRKAISAYLSDELKLSLKPKNTFLNSAQNGLTFLGKRIFPSLVRIASPNKRRMLKKMKRAAHAVETGTISEETFLRSMNSYWSQLQPFPRLRKAILKGQSA